jgi:general nucleoside transport system ATP-binding protein
VAEIHDRILAARNDEAAVLLVSEDLDELFALSGGIVVMPDGRLVHETDVAEADLAVIGRSMAGHHGAVAHDGAAVTYPAADRPLAASAD